MGNLKINLSKKKIIHNDKQSLDNAVNFTLKDINTNGFMLKQSTNGEPEEAYVSSPNLDKNAVKEALHNILTFKSGEAVLDPEFGLGQIYSMLYMPFDKHTVAKMLKTVRSIIATYEPRIEVLKIPTQYSEDEQTITMTIYYSIPELNAKDSYELVLQK